MMVTPVMVTPVTVKLKYGGNSYYTQKHGDCLNDGNSQLKYDG